MSSQSISIADFRLAAKAAVDEATLNGLQNRTDTVQQDRLWVYFDALEEIATSGQKQAKDPQQKPLQGEVVEDE